MLNHHLHWILAHSYHHFEWSNEHKYHKSEHLDGEISISYIYIYRLIKSAFGLVSLMDFDFLSVASPWVSPNISDARHRGVWWRVTHPPRWPGATKIYKNPGRFTGDDAEFTGISLGLYGISCDFWWILIICEWFFMGFHRGFIGSKCDLMGF